MIFESLSVDGSEFSVDSSKQRSRDEWDGDANERTGSIRRHFTQRRLSMFHYLEPIQRGLELLSNHVKTKYDFFLVCRVILKVFMTTLNFCDEISANSLSITRSYNVPMSDMNLRREDDRATLV